ncbi:MAG TPA: AraC family transcriptional regulator [Thermoanaerobaculia bacterium]|nr:AraC family transcriptional regulator [Thermoanaerobaculia bacterium]
MAKIAVEVDRALAGRAASGAPGGVTARMLAQGDGWTVRDVVCTSGPQDRPFEEQHELVGIAIVAAGSFQYRSATGQELMTPGSLLLGSAGECFECGHEHGAGDRCLSFQYSPDFFERLAAEAGARGGWPGFRELRLPPLRVLSPLVALGLAGLTGAVDVAWEELALQIAAQAVELVNSIPTAGSPAPPSVVARVTRIVRSIERQPDAVLTLENLAREAGLSPFHFLRTFERLTGVTPHQYILRARLREVAVRLVAEPAKVIDIAFDCGFGDVSSFNRAFRAEFGASPRAYRFQMTQPLTSLGGIS